MMVLNLLSIITALFVLSGLVLCAIIVWTIATRRDELYQVKYQHFLRAAGTDAYLEDK